MKRTIIVEVLLVFILAVLIVAAVHHWEWYNAWSSQIQDYTENGFPYGNAMKDAMAGLAQFRTYGIFDILAMLADFAAMVCLTIPAIKKLKDKIAAKHSEHKTAKAEADKQARIEQLKADLEELKKDE